MWLRPSPGAGITSIRPDPHHGARAHHDPQSAKTPPRDPLAIGARFDSYSYCNGDPVNGLDPDGRCGLDAGASGGSSINQADQQYEDAVYNMEQDYKPELGHAGYQGNNGQPPPTQDEETSNLIDEIPIFGQVKGFVEGMTGYNFITGQYLTTTQQVMQMVI